MLSDPKTRRLATEFACQWLHIHDFDHLDEKSERHFPTFGGLRGAMYEESILFFTDLFQNDRSVLDILDADHTFLNEDLAKHYGIPGVKGPTWRRVDGVQRFSRGRHSDAGHDAGQAIGRVAHQPDPARQLAQRSRARRETAASAQECAAAARYGSGRLDRAAADRETQQRPGLRQVPCAHRSVRLRAGRLRRDRPPAREGRQRVDDRHENGIPDGTKIEGLAGLQGYLLNTRRDAFVRQFCRKLLGYALGARSALRRTAADGDASEPQDEPTTRSERCSKRSSAADSSARFADASRRAMIDRSGGRRQRSRLNGNWKNSVAGHVGDELKCLTERI